MVNSTVLTTVLPTLVPASANHATVVFSWYDYGLFFIMLGLSSLIGIYFGCFGSKQSTTGEYLLGGKTMKVIPVVISLVSSHVSGITLLGIPADVYLFGATFMNMIFSMLLVALAVVYIYLPVFFELQCTSTYEYLELRFDNKTRILASFMFAIGLLFILPIVIYIPALAFAAATGIDVHIITPVVCGVCIFYTTIGGLKAVVWTDTLQFTITIGAVITVFFLGVSSTGGFENIYKRALEGDRLNIFDFDPSPFKRESFWIIVIGTAFHWTAMSGANQGCLQKFLSVSTLKEAKQAAWLYALGIGLLNTISILTGLIMYAKYSSCDPFSTGEVKRNDQLLPYYVMDVAGNVPGLPGLFIAGVVSAALSTLSAHLNCLAGTIYEDFIAKFMPKGTSEKTASNILKLVVVVTGVICTILVYIIEHLGGIFPLAVAFSSVTGGPVLGLFSLGMLFPKVNAKGGFWGTVSAQLCMLIIILGAQYYKYTGAIHYDHKPLSTDGCVVPLNATVLSSQIMSAPLQHEEPLLLFKMSHYYYTVLGTFLTLFFGWLISWLTGKDNRPARKELLCPLVHFLLPKDDEGVIGSSQYYSVEKALHILSDNEKKEKEDDV